MNQPINDVRYQAKCVRMLFKCKYLEDQNGKNPLTLKGWGYIKWPWFWRVINNIKLATSKKYRINMMTIMDYYSKQTENQ